MLKINTTLTTLQKATSDLVGVFIFEDRDHFTLATRGLAEALGSSAGLLQKPRFEAKEKQVMLMYPTGLQSRQLLVIGLGKAKQISLEKLRRASALAARTAGGIKARSLLLMEPSPEALAQFEPPGFADAWEAIGMALAEGAALSVYRYDKYLSPGPEQRIKLSTCTIASADKKRLRQIEQGVHRARIVCEATTFARDLSNAPGNELDPETLASRTRRTGQQHGFQVTVLNERAIARLGMGGLEGVALGSAKPPRFLIMEYNKGKAHRGTVVLVGKGVTFDSGGISIKPAANMAEMKMDMAGAAAVIGAISAAARLKIPLHLVGLVPATENLPGGRAFKPGDILRHLNGKTSEIDNTDAEGRLILADALSYAQRYKPDAVIDLATLTGAVVVALGHFATGMLGNDADIMAQLKAAGERTYERVWELPMYEEYERLIKSDVADVKNIGGRWAGAITGALFLKNFVGTCRWAHLDIAGTAILEEPEEYAPKGASGVGVRLLVDFLEHWKKPGPTTVDK